MEPECALVRSTKSGVELFSQGQGPYVDRMQIAALLNLNLAAFYNDYDDLQVAKTVSGLTQVENAATAKTKGIEIEASFLSENGFYVNAGLSLLSGKYGSYIDATDPRDPLVAPDLSGYDPPDAPAVDAILSIQKDIQTGSNTLTPRIDFHYRDRYWATEFNDYGDYGVLGQGAYTRIDASLAFTFGQNWSVRVWGENLTDEDIQTFGVVGGNGSLIATYSDPRTVGVNISYDF